MAGSGRGAVAMSEGGQRMLPVGAGVQEARLMLASLGKVNTPGAPDSALPGPPSLPELEEVAWRVHECLEFARRAYASPVPNTTREASWLALLEGKAEDGLCGRGAQRLLEARLAGLERETELAA